MGVADPRDLMRQDRARTNRSGPLWCTAIGNYGDVLACMGNMRERLREYGLERTNVLYYGTWSDMPEFLPAQDFINDVIATAPPSPDRYQKTVGMLCGLRNYRNDFQYILRGLPLELESLEMTHVDRYHLEGLDPPHYWHGCELPAEARDRARELWKNAALGSGDGIYLLHPLSDSSASEEAHWSLWLQAIGWLCENTPHLYVLTGQHRFQDLPAHPQLIDFSGETKSMLDVFALAKMCRGIISTSNSLSMWSIVERIPALIVLNAVLFSEKMYFRRWISCEPNILLPNAATLEDFAEAFEQLQKQISGSCASLK